MSIEIICTVITVAITVYGFYRKLAEDSRKQSSIVDSKFFQIEQSVKLLEKDVEHHAERAASFDARLEGLNQTIIRIDKTTVEIKTMLESHHDKD